MRSKIVLFVAFALAVVVTIKYCTGYGREGLFRISECYESDSEVGAVFLVEKTYQGHTYAKVIVSRVEGPDSPKIGSTVTLPSDSNAMKFYPVECPNETQVKP